MDKDLVIGPRLQHHPAPVIEGHTPGWASQPRELGPVAAKLGDIIHRNGIIIVEAEFSHRRRVRVACAQQHIAADGAMIIGGPPMWPDLGDFGEKRRHPPAPRLGKIRAKDDMQGEIRVGLQGQTGQADMFEP